MRIAFCLMAAVLLVAPVIAADDPPGFAMWKADELKQRDQALSKKVGLDHSARETLAEYKSQRFRLLLRDADGAPEVHENEVDVVIVQSGEGTLLVGGKMIGSRASGGRGGAASAGAGGRGRGTAAEGGGVGTSIEGGQRYALGPGDVVHIPAKVPHAFLVPKGKHLTYILVKFPPPAD